MGIFSFFKKKAFFSEQDQARIVTAISSAEKSTSGEIRPLITKISFFKPKGTPSDFHEQGNALRLKDTEQKNGEIINISKKRQKYNQFN